MARLTLSGRSSVAWCSGTDCRCILRFPGGMGGRWNLITSPTPAFQQIFAGTLPQQLLQVPRLANSAGLE